MPSPASVFGELLGDGLVGGLGDREAAMLMVVAASLPLDEAHPVRASTPAIPTAAALIVLFISPAPSDGRAARTLSWLTRAE